MCIKKNVIILMLIALVLFTVGCSGTVSKNKSEIDYATEYINLHQNDPETELDGYIIDYNIDYIVGDISYYYAQSDSGSINPEVIKPLRIVFNYIRNDILYWENIYCDKDNVKVSSVPVLQEDLLYDEKDDLLQSDISYGIACILSGEEIAKRLNVEYMTVNEYIQTMDKSFDEIGDEYMQNRYIGRIIGETGTFTGKITFVNGLYALEQKGLSVYSPGLKDAFFTDGYLYFDNNTKIEGNSLGFYYDGTEYQMTGILTMVNGKVFLSIPQFGSEWKVEESIDKNVYHTDTEVELTGFIEPTFKQFPNWCLGLMYDIEVYDGDRLIPITTNQIFFFNEDNLNGKTFEECSDGTTLYTIRGTLYNYRVGGEIFFLNPSIVAAQ